MSAAAPPEPAGKAPDAVVDPEPEALPQPTNEKSPDDDESDSHPETATGTIVGPVSEQQQRAEEDQGVLLVDWDGPNDPENPRKCVFSRACYHSCRVRSCVNADLNL